MKIKNDGLFQALKGFFTIYLTDQRRVSANTLKSYRDALNLFIDYLLIVTGLPLLKLTLANITRDSVSGFLDWIESDRHCGVATRNQRLMCIKSFIGYAAMMDYVQVPIQVNISKIPLKKEPVCPVEFYSEAALTAILDQPDPLTKIGLRDRFFMILAYDTAARCQELLDLRLRDIEIRQLNSIIYLTGKGSKTRIDPLSAKTIEHYRQYLNVYHPENTRNMDDLVFYTIIHGVKQAMSQDNVAYFIKKYGRSAKRYCSEVPDKLHAHQFRHTRAMHLYRGGMPMALLAEFMGHTSIQSTQIYAYADAEMKREAIRRAMPGSDDIAYEPPAWENDEMLIRKLYGLK